MNLTRVSYTPPYTHIPPTSATCLSDSHGSAPMAHIHAYIHIYIHTRVPPTSATRHKDIDLHIYTHILPTSASRPPNSHGAAPMAHIYTYISIHIFIHASHPLVQPIINVWIHMLIPTFHPPVQRVFRTHTGPCQRRPWPCRKRP